jgi:hypothetical protein
MVTFMAESPIIKTLNNLVAQLKESTEALREAEKSVSGLTAAIRALAQVCEDEEVKTAYLLALEEISGKPGFVDAVRSALRAARNIQTATEIKGTILLMKKLDLSVYSNPMASIHTTLRRMKEKGEIEEVQNDKGERAYRLPPGSPGVTLPNQEDIAERRAREGKAPIPPASMRRIPSTPGEARRIIEPFRPKK